MATRYQPNESYQCQSDRDNGRRKYTEIRLVDKYCSNDETAAVKPAQS